MIEGREGKFFRFGRFPGELVLHVVEGIHINSGEGNAFLTSKLVGNEFAAFLRDAVAGPFLTFCIFVAGLFEEINESNFGLVKNFYVPGNIAHQVCMVFADHFSDFAAVGIELTVATENL